MALPWLIVLQNVPWLDVIRNAPKVADGAKRLWSTVSGKPVGKVGSGGSVNNQDIHSLNDFSARLQQAEAEIDTLHAQMLSSSELIKALAEQNAEMATGMQMLRRKMIWLTVIICLLGLSSIISIFLLFVAR